MPQRRYRTRAFDYDTNGVHAAPNGLDPTSINITKEMMKVRNGAVNATRVDFCDIAMELLVPAFVPDGYLDSHFVFY